MEQNETVVPVDTMEDIEECFRPVVQAHGRSMFALVMNAGMAGQAAERIAQTLQRVQSANGLAGLAMLSQAFNQVSNAYVTQMGWTEEQLAQCDRDIQRAFAGKIVVAAPGSSLILNS